MLDETLGNLGLRDEESKTFLFLLENGPQTAGNLAKKSGLSRPSLYGFLRKLQNLELVIESQKNGTKIFAASSEERVSRIFEDRIQSLEKGKRSVQKAYRELVDLGITVSPKFQLFEGKEGVRYLLKDMLLYRDIETKAYWPIKSMMEILSESFFKELNKERIQRGLYTRAIWPQGQAVDIRKHPYLGVGDKFLREIRLAPKDIAFSMGYWIYGDKVAFISSKREAFGFIIESKELVEMLSTQFEVLWKISKPLSLKGKDAEKFFERDAVNS